VTPFVKAAVLVVKKDFSIELKSGEILYTTLFFAASCVLIFAIAFVKEGQPIEGAGAGILWISVLFAGNLALGRTFERERYGDTIRALLLVPAPRSAIYVGKLLGIMMLLSAAELLLVPIVAFLFHEPLLGQPVLLGLLLVLGTLGFAAVGTLFAAMLLRSGARTVLLPVVLYPFTIPVIIAGVLGTSALVASPADQAMARFWIWFMVSFDAVFLTLSLWTFEPLMTE
jgi:heme exporter protein CcmB